MRITKPTAITAAAAMLAAGSIVALPTVATATPSVDAAIVINEVYPGGGNDGAAYTHDFVELRNVSDTAVNVTGWSVQYSSAAGTNWSGVIPLTGTIEPGAYYLVQGATGGAAGAALPTPNASGNVNMGGNGNFALANQATALTCEGVACATAANVVDLFGRGAARLGATQPAAVTNATSWSRDAVGTNTLVNSTDFTVGAPSPMAAEVEPPVDPELTAISAIQGTGAASPLLGQPVIVRGVVTAAYPAGGLWGYMIQTPGTGGTIPTASEGLYIRVSTGSVDKAIGDYIEVTGTVTEYQGLTQVETTAADVTVVAETVDPVTPLAIAWPTTDAERELIESMLIAPTDSFVVSNTYSTNQYGELGLATGGMPLIQPTDTARPGSPEYAAAVADNAARGVILDDGATTNYLSTANNGLTPPYVSMTNPVRVGQPVTFVDPVVVDYRNNAWKLQPTATVTGPDNTGSPVLLDNDRPATPDLAAIGDTGLTVAAFNVLNYFTTLGADTPGCNSYKDRDGNGVTVSSGCDPRGAWDAVAFGRQQTKIVAAINAIDASVIGLMEIENSAKLGEAADEATATLVAALNAASEPGKWAYVASSAELPALGEQDVISNAIIYQPAEVEPVGDMRVLGTLSGAGQPFSNAREPLGQAFAPVGGGDAFFVAVNHFKSKGSGSGLDADQGDGQGASNWSRVQQAEALVDWVDSILPAYPEPIEAAFLMGDFNSYSMEDPMQVFYDEGYTNVNGALGAKKYSYSFSGLSGSLDHVVANEAAMERVTGSDIWNINAPESIALEYSRYNYHGTIFHAPDAYRSSDHDPVIVGLTADAPVPDVAEITLLNINDFHGRIDPGSPLARRMALTVEQLREAAPGGSLFLSAGDNIGASLFASSSADDVPTLQILNALELGTTAVGNHEFDRGFDRLTNEVAADSDFSHLGANVYHKGTTDPALDEFELFTVDGITIGVIGVVTEETPALVSPGGIATLDFGDPVEAVNRVAAVLSDGDEANGEADVIVAEYHEGANVASSYEDAKAASAVFTDIAVNTSEHVDVIFMGHTHLKYAWDGEIPGSTDTRPIVQTGSYGANVGKVVLTVDKATGDVTAYTAENVAASGLSGAALSEAIADYPRAVEVEQIVIDALADAAVIGSEVLGSKTADITTAFSGGAFVDGLYTGGTRDNRGAASTMGTLVGNALKATASPAGEVADIGIVNPGGMRAEFLMSAGADITVAQANAVLPFVNNVWFTTLTGEQFVKVLNQQWQRDSAGNVPSRAYLQLGLSDNVTYVSDPTRPEGERIISVTIDGEPIDLAAEYRISSFSFLVQGGDNFHEFANGTDTVDTGLIDRDAWFAYIEAESPLSPIYAKSGIDVVGLPTDATLAAGDTIDLTVGNINLTSQGSPENTSITVSIGDTELGDFPVTAGTADISVTIPADTPAGPATLTITAPASGTTATIPVTVTEFVPTTDITLLNINDFHGRIDPGSPLARRMALTVEQLREAAPGGSLFLSAGDNIGASLFASSSADDVPTLQILNALELGTTAVGNHEFDRGFDRLTNEVAADSDFSHLGANVYHKGTTDPALDEFELFTVDGITIGVIGVVTEETPALVSPGGIATLDFGDPVEAVNRVAAVLSDGDEANGEADVIVAEYHEGANVASSYEDAKAASAVFTDIAVNTSEHVDVIFMGHTHLKYAWDGEIPGSTDTRPIVQTGSYGANVGKVVLTVDKATGDVTAYTAENVAASGLSGAALSEAIADYPRAVEVEQIVIDALADAAVIGSEVLGSKTADITTAFSGGAFVDGLYTGGTRDNRGAASTMGTLVGNALKATASPAGEVADIGIVNPGGMRAEFLMSAGADITVAQANAVLPFVNNVWFTTLTGEQFVKVLNQQWQRDSAGNVPSRAYLQLGLSDNVTYVSDPTRPEGERIISVTIDGEPIDLAAEYRISSFSFLVQGGDNFHEFANGTDTVDTGLIDRDAWFAYIEAESPLSPIYAKSGIDVVGLPTDATLAAGDTIDLTVGNINLTSQGSPENTSITVSIGDTELGDFPVTAGTADISVTIPADTPAGPATLTITAPASGTTATIPVTVESDVVEPSFTDVPADHPFFAEIEALSGRGIINGYADGTFLPNASVSRQAAAAFLYRAIEGGTAPECTVAPFTDVPVDHPFCGEITWMVAEGITSGYADDTFKPGATVSRQAMAAFLYRAFGPDEAAPACTTAPFTDIPTGHPFCGEITWLVEQEIASGYSDGTFLPNASVSRQAMAAYLYRAMPL